MMRALSVSKRYLEPVTAPTAPQKDSVALI
jgi:hypothetical protein